VEAGDRLLVLEAMKMQQPVLAPLSGRVRSVGVAQGDQVEEGQVLALVGAE
jgi:biotin carboxyl carrier protein